MDFYYYKIIIIIIFLSIHIWSIITTYYLQKDRKITNKQWINTTFNILLFLLLSWFTLDFLKDRFAFNKDILSILFSLGIILFSMDTWFYWWHRSLHRIPFLKKHIHDIHHESFDPLPVEYIYTHPIEAIVGAIPLGFPFFFMKVNMFGFLLAIILRQLHEVEIHTSEEENSKFIILNPPKNHYLHHKKGGGGNYASMLPFWDSIMNTSLT